MDMKIEIADSGVAAIKFSKQTSQFLRKFVMATANTAVNSHLNNKYGWRVPYDVAQMVTDRLPGVGMDWKAWGYLRDALSDLACNPFVMESARKRAVDVMRAIERADQLQARKRD